MRLHSWPWASSALPLLLYLAHCVAAVERHYYIAAVNINWDYTANGNQRYSEGETIVVTFKNMADRPCSIHPHGITYGKQSEGSLYFDNTSEFEKEDDVISPGNEHTYYWDVTPEVAPKATDPHCITYMYSSHYDIIKDYNTGLIGTLLICKKDSLDDSGKQHNFHQEFMLLFGVFDENNGWYSKGGPPLDENVKYTINGYTNGSIPGLSVCAHSEVNWNLLGMSSEQELFSVHFNGQVLQRGGHKVSSVGLISGTATSAEMIAVHPGRWLLSSFISKHLECKSCLRLQDIAKYFGMHGFLTVNKCKEFTAPKRRITIVQSRESQEWTYYIAAEEEVWDYAPNLPENVDKYEHFRAAFLKQSAERIGKKYKKALFTQYKDALFKERAEHKVLITYMVFFLCPQIVFKNKASRPYSIYPHGLTIDKASHAVQPGETYTYVWRVVEEDEPLERDARCLTRMYHSAVNTPKDIASGLIGPLLICKIPFGYLLRADKEQHATFAIFDENKSWYLAENINTYCEEPAKVKPDDPEFYKSNIMHTINGYVYESGQVLGFCNGEIVTWHVSSVGNQDDIQTATFYGHTFELNNREEDILSLFPMTGETITMGMANDGHAVSPRYFSPRGFGPSELALQGTRSKSSEEDMQGKSIIIGVPRRDFSDYEIYVTDQKQNMEDIPDENEDYEYVEYKDPYKKQIDLQNTVIDDGSKYSLKITGTKARSYFITAEEVDWDYAGYGQRRGDRSAQKERPTLFKKVAFRAYLDSSFTTPHIRGELDEHLGILGPVIKAEIDETIYIVFRNLASRPYSLHVNGVSYGKNMEGLKYDDQSPYWYKQDDAIEPNATFIYMWTVNAKVGPQQDESDCRIWAYYSGVNPERDIHSGLIGPLLVCRKGTLNTNPVDTQDFMLLFMTFDENKSWYYEKNREILEKTNRKAVMDPEFNNNIKFSAINGIIYSLKGLRMYSNHLIKWHLINMGSPKDLHSIHFHGQTFLNKNMYDHRQAVYPLLPGGFATLEMWPSKPGLWLLESEVGLSQQRGMQTLFLVLDNVCDHSLGLNSGTVKDSQITASDYRSYWLPSLARLHNTGKYNAWSTTKSEGWIQVDFQRPVVISKVATQGAKQLFTSHFVQNYTVSYSTDRKRWIFYKGDSKAFRKTFEGNREAHEVKENIFFPPIIGRYVRLHPSHSYNYPTIRMDFYGCELDGCSVPLGMQSGLITDQQITASSVATNWYSGPWHSWYGRLDKQGTANAWQSKSNDMQPWLQIELKVVKKITGIVTQGAKTLGTEMFVTSYVLEYSDDGIIWTKYTDDEDYEQKTFSGNSDNISHVKNYIYPPIFSKYIRIIPKKWQNAVTMRIELLGCDFE
uniref:F5/8 type C domain-containing protein n=1 Tax=Electrophorus electricus TaxID=8005 RepID=A0AAY5ETV7_ELEEL